MLKFAILKKIGSDSDAGEIFEVTDTKLDGYLEYDVNEFVREVVVSLKSKLKKGLLTRKIKMKDIEFGLPKALDDATKKLKSKTIYVK